MTTYSHSSCVGAGSRIAMAILDSIKPYWYQNDPEATIKLQGNWPRDAEFGVILTTHNRDFYNHGGSEIKFFSSQEEFDEFMDEAKSFYPGSDFSCRIASYRWDLGPEFMDSMILN